MLHDWPMILLGFSLENHRSFKDSASLDMLAPRLRTVVPKDGATWIESTRRVAAIFGPNASGKSAALDGLRHLQRILSGEPQALRRKTLPYRPFLLDEESRALPSRYTLDFVAEGTRYQYGVAHTATTVVEEWLYRYETSWKTVLFERSESKTTFGRSLKGDVSVLQHMTTGKDLILAGGAVSRHPTLGLVHQALVEGIRIITFAEFDRQGRVDEVLEMIEHEELSLGDLAVMMRVADVGISSAEITLRDVPEDFRATMAKILKVIDEANASEDSSGRFGTTDHELEEFAKELVFKHTGHEGAVYSLSPQQQSTGTLTWLAMVAPAVSALRRGQLLCVDELDASLHPHLAAALVQIFRDRNINTRGAQLVFTTHDVSFLSPQSPSRLDPEEVWFAEKGADGRSELFCLADFPVRESDNLLRRYMMGRYGAIPRVAPSILAQILATSPNGQEDTQ